MVLQSPAPSEGVLLSAAKLFAGRARHDAQECRIFAELGVSLLPDTVRAERRQIAMMLVRHPQTPMPVLQLLAADADPLTAYPVLKNTPGIAPQTLVRQAERGPDSLRKILAQRVDLPPEAAKALAVHGGAEVISLLLARDDLVVTDAIADALLARPAIVSEFGIKLAAKGIMSPQALMAQYLTLDAPLRTKALAAAEMEALVETATAMQIPGQPASNRARAALRCDPAISSALENAALHSDHRQFDAALAKGLSLPRALATEVSQDPGGDALAIALKALNISEAVAGNIFVRQLGSRMGLEQIRGLMRLHARLSLSAAQMLVRSWSQAAPASTQPAHHAALTTETDGKARLRGTSDPNRTQTTAPRPQTGTGLTVQRQTETGKRSA
ncbi:DUF2336 domain-containing protein [Roseibium hamelinense]|nr:DUF2336 domain-containing protein [Roseibium hamelinense]